MQLLKTDMDNPDFRITNRRELLHLDHDINALGKGKSSSKGNGVKRGYNNCKKLPTTGICEKPTVATVKL
eukprot:3873458-Amphidinium_carterae.1